MQKEEGSYLGFWFLFGKMGLILKGVLSIAKKEGRSRRNILKIFQNNHSIGVTYKKQTLLRNEKYLGKT